MLENSLISFPEDNSILCRFWEDECVVYNQLTGNTHLVDGIGVEVFKAVSENVSSRREVLQKIQSVFDFERDFNLETFLDNLLLEYQQLGLLAVTENHPA